MRRARSAVRATLRSGHRSLGQLAICALTIAVAGCAPRPRGARYSSAGLPLDSVLTAPTQAVASRAVPVGEAEGVVVDAYSGAPLIASVYVRTDDAAKPLIISGTSRDGYFHLSHLPSHRVVAHASITGYSPDSVLLDAHSGHMIRFGLHAVRLIVCALPVITDSAARDSAAALEQANAIIVSARDARTGSIPRSAVTIRVRDGAFADSATSTSANMWAGAVVIGAAPARDGVYDVEVTASGYQPWHARGVHPFTGNCGIVVSRTLQVWLLPN